MEAGKKFNLFVLSGSHTVNAFYTSLLIPVLPLIVKEFGLNYVQAGLIVSAYALANSVFQFPISFISDYTGRWRTVLALSLFTQAVPVILYGFAWSFSILLLFVFLSGIGSSAYHPPTVALITHELPGRRGLSMGLFHAGGEVGMIITPVLVAWLAFYFDSWRSAAQVFVVPGVIWAALVWFRLKDVFTERRPIREAARSTYRELVLNRAFQLLVALSSFRVMGFRGITAFIPLLLAQEFGYDTRGIGWVLTSYYTVGAFSTIIVGRLSDGRNRARFIMTLTLAVTVLLAMIPWARANFALLALLMSVACVLPAVPSLVLAVGTELVSERQRSSAVGFIYGVNEAASALAPIVGGVVAESIGLRSSFYFYSFMFGLGALTSVFLNRTLSRRGAALAEASA